MLPPKKTAAKRIWPIPAIYHLMHSFLAHLESRTGETIKTLDDLVRIPTAVPPGQHYEEAVDYMVRRLKELGFEVEKIFMPRAEFEAKNPAMAQLEGERANLSAVKDIGAEKTLLINTHLDVVPAGGGWTVAPFEVTQQDGRIYGRGVADSKGGPAALLTVLTAMEEKVISPKYNLNIAMTTDEEMGPYSGLCHLADLGKLKADYFLSMDGDIDDITTAANGNAEWQIAVSGRSYHSGSSFLGVNAIEKSIPIMTELMELKARLKTKRSNVPASRVLSKITGIDTIVPVLNITMIDGGIKLNIVPDRCTIMGDRRFIPEETFAEVCGEMADALNRAREKYPDLSFKFNCDEIYPPMLTDINHPWVSAVKQAASEVSGSEVMTAGSQGSLDVAYAVGVTGLPACCYGVGRRIESSAHGDDENIRIEDLITYTKFLAKLICED